MKKKFCNIDSRLAAEEEKRLQKARMVLMASEARKREEEEELERKHAEIRCSSCVCVRACGCVSRVSDVTDARLQDTLFGLAQVLAANTGQA
jgi:hypothetical protein